MIIFRDHTPLRRIWRAITRRPAFRHIATNKARAAREWGIDDPYQLQLLRSNATPHHQIQFGAHAAPMRANGPVAILPVIRRVGATTHQQPLPAPRPTSEQAQPARRDATPRHPAARKGR